MKNKKPRIQILLVEDDPNLRTVLKDYLDMLGYGVYMAIDGEDGYRSYLEKKPDLCILDVMMPKKDGFTLSRDIRQVDKMVPIIFLTAKGLKEDRIEGFKTGCDDYITKPFSSEELSLRIEAVLRRCALQKENGVKPEEEIFHLGRFTFDPANMVLQIGDNQRILTRKETSLLRMLCIHKNSLLKREDALLSVWGNDDYFIGRSMDVFIAKLRKYLKEDPSISIQNVHGTGFKLQV
ncbi:MAG: response regulator transcription factor [Bacteroidales bacterium]|nr:response regulator transcription factor [Lentimicrobiaceae bacterium]MDD5694324.1 response regulator transcription factor [Bacteroidales bacterium]